LLALVTITGWHWAGFIVFVLICLVLDLRVFHRQAHTVHFREALAWTGVWVALALAFALAVRSMRGEKEGWQFLTGYFIELSLSMDNVFVIALIFSYFGVASKHQHRLLYWGILGAIVMRGMMIWLGVALISLFDWILYVFGAFLLITGVKMLIHPAKMDPSQSRIVRLLRRIVPITPEPDGQKFITRWQGRLALTPLAVVLVLIETTDLLFAIDSIPAIFAVTKKAFIVFTSNIFAILGLRSLYFVLAGAIRYFRYLKVGLSLVLVFIGIKMLIDPGEHPPRWWFQYDISTPTSLLVVAVILLVSILCSIVAARREKKESEAKSQNPNPKSQ
jgi:tellurite resistance protein TerC